MGEYPLDLINLKSFLRWSEEIISNLLSFTLDLAGSNPARDIQVLIWGNMLVESVLVSPDQIIHL